MATFKFSLRESPDGHQEITSAEIDSPLLSAKVIKNESGVDVEIKSDNATVSSVLDFLSNAASNFLPGYGVENPQPEDEDKGDDD